LRRHFGQTKDDFGEHASPAADKSLPAAFFKGFAPGWSPAGAVLESRCRRLAACCKWTSTSESSAKEQPQDRQQISSSDSLGVLGCLKAKWVQSAFSLANFRQQMQHANCRRILHFMATTWNQRR